LPTGKNARHSTLKLSTGFAMAALMVLKAIVANAIKIPEDKETANVHQLISTC